LINLSLSYQKSSKRQRVTNIWLIQNEILLTGEELCITMLTARWRSVSILTGSIRQDLYTTPVHKSLPRLQGKVSFRKK